MVFGKASFWIQLLFPPLTPSSTTRGFLCDHVDLPCLHSPILSSLLPTATPWPPPGSRNVYVSSVIYPWEGKTQERGPCGP